MTEMAVNGLFCNLNIPLGWSQMTGEVEINPVALAQENINRLQVILGLDDYSSRDLHDEETGLAAEIQRLDFKINIILGLVAQLATVRNELPTSVPVTLSADVLNFELSGNSPPQGAMLALELFLDKRYPFPLVFHGRVDTAFECSGVNVILVPFPTAFQELLEKYIFRCHRRHIARLKNNSL